MICTTVRTMVHNGQREGLHNGPHSFSWDHCASREQRCASVEHHCANGINIRITPWIAHDEFGIPWLNVVVIRRKTKEDRKRRYHLGWNGKRMSRCGDWQIMQERHPDIAAAVLAHMRDTFSRLDPNPRPLGVR